MVHGSRRRAGSEETEFLTHTCGIKSSQIPKADKESCLHQLLSTVWTPSLVSSGITAATQPRTPGFVSLRFPTTPRFFSRSERSHTWEFSATQDQRRQIFLVPLTGELLEWWNSVFLASWMLLDHSSNTPVCSVQISCLPNAVLVPMKPEPQAGGSGGTERPNSKEKGHDCLVEGKIWSLC